MTILTHLHFLAINDSSGVGDFFRQIGGLLIITCAAGLIWIGLMALVMQRAAERRRRAQLGLEPLPAIHVTAYRWIMNAINPPDAGKAAAPERSRPAARSEPMPAPDLEMLTGDLPQPDLADMTGHDVPRAAPETVSPTPEPEPPVEEAADFTPPTESGVGEDTTPEQPSQGEPPDSVELLRVWRDLTDGALVVEIGGKRFRSLSELRGADLERQFRNVVRDLDALSAPPRPAPPSRSAAKDETPPRKTRAKQPPPEEPPPAAMGPGAMLRQMRRAAMGQAPEPVEQKPERSIADQIEDLLQARIAETPSFSGREIHVRPSLAGGVRIEVDGKFYDGVGDVDDGDVRDLLAGVVREWEESQ
jgi:hypothetical protein